MGKVRDYIDRYNPELITENSPYFESNEVIADRRRIELANAVESIIAELDEQVTDGLVNEVNFFGERQAVIMEDQQLMLESIRETHHVFTVMQEQTEAAIARIKAHEEARKEQEAEALLKRSSTSARAGGLTSMCLMAEKGRSQ